MKIIISILAATAISAISNASPWTIQRETDAMTDEIYFLVGTHSTAAIEIMPYITYRPAIVLQIHPKGFNQSGGLLYTSESTLTIEHDGFIRYGNDITIRFDKEPPATENWSSSTDRRAALHPHPHDFISKLLNHTNLTVRYVTSLGSIRTAQFNISDLKPTLKKLKTDFANIKAATK